jgi:hypothetical protein
MIMCFFHRSRLLWRLFPVAAGEEEPAQKKTSQQDQPVSDIRVIGDFFYFYP